MSKMSKRWYMIYILAIVLLPVFLLLVSQFKSPADIMAPPGAYGEKTQIQKAFEASLGDKNEFTLKYPTGGHHKSAFVMGDIDSDGEEEAIVFYTLKSDEATVRVNMLDYRDDEWQSVYDEAGYGSEVVSVDFCDFNKDGLDEVVICWNLYEANLLKVMTVHSVEVNNGSLVSLEPIVNQSYSYMDIADFDNDKTNEIFVVWIDNTDIERQKAYATLFKMSDDDKMAPMCKNISMDGTVSSYSDMQFLNVDGTKIAHLDAYKGENSMITEVLWWDKDKASLISPTLDKETLSNTVTLRNPAIPTMDIDGDGVLEIPANNVSPAAPEDIESDNIKLELTTWKSVTKTGFNEKMYSFVNSTAGYIFKLPESLKDSVIAYKQTSKGVMSLYLTTDGENTSAPLFTLLVKERGELTPEDKYTFKETHGDTVVYGTLTSAGEELGFTNKIIEDSIIFLDIDTSEKT